MSPIPQKTKQKVGNELKNSPRFPQGKVVQKMVLPRNYPMRQESKEKLDWAQTQVLRALRSNSNEEIAIAVTNFDAHPSTMKNWLNRGVKSLFPSGNRHLSFRYKGTRRNGTLYVEVLFGKPPRKGKGLTERV